MWGQQWGNIYELVAPESAESGLDETKLLKDNAYDAVKMVKVAEEFFTSMGFEPLPETFWSRSLITKPTFKRFTTSWVIISINVLIKTSQLFIVTARMTASMKRLVI